MSTSPTSPGASPGSPPGGPSGQAAGVLLICAAAEAVELSEPLRQPMSSGPIALHVATDSASALALFAEHRPEVVVIAASLLGDDTAALVDSVRRMVGRAQVCVVVLGDVAGPVSSALDAAEIGGDRFVPRPLSPKALRYAVAVSIDSARLARRGRVSSHAIGQGKPGASAGAVPDGPLHDSIAAVLDDEEPPHVTKQRRPRRTSVGAAVRRVEQRARWARLADSIATSVGDDLEEPDDPGERLAPHEEAGDRAASIADDDWDALSDHADQAEPLPPLMIQTRRTGVTAEPAPPPTSERDSVWSSPEILAQLPATLPAPAAPEGAPRSSRAEAPPEGPPSRPSPPSGSPYARQLRQKMSELAQRLFSHQDPASLEAAPRHDHQMEFDLAALVEEPGTHDVSDAVRASRTAPGAVARETQPGSRATWEPTRDVRQRVIPDSGELVRGTCDAPAIVVRMWTSGTTGRVVFTRGEVEKVVFFDRGRPVFASSTELHDRMGELLYREGKITHAQYMHSKSLVAESGRRMGEILVDLGYLKRRELYPAVRRHVEDIVYSLFAWDHGSYRIVLEDAASAERIRLSRHPEALIVEGVRRKLDRVVLERLVGPPSTVLELADRERVLALAPTIELTNDERAVIAAIDGQADLPALSRAAGTSIASVYPLAWALIVLGYAFARRETGEVIDSGEELTVPVESDLAIDRERVRARWLLVADADYFSLLGVRRDATSFEIRRAYEASRRDFAAEGFPAELRRELARELDDISTVLDEAFRVLRDDSLRRQYLAHLVE